MLKGLTVVTMEKIMELLSNLNEKLKKHPDVRSVYKRSMENEKKQVLIHNYSLYTDAWRAFKTNLQMLREIDFEELTENKPTIDVLKVALSLLQYSVLDKTEIEAIIKKEDDFLLFLIQLLCW